MVGNSGAVLPGDFSRQSDRGWYGKNPHGHHFGRNAANNEPEGRGPESRLSQTSRGTMLVSDGQGNILGPDQSGDEPTVMVAHLPDVPIVVDKVRIRGGRLLVEQFHPDVILLDDGFQYRWLH